MTPSSAEAPDLSLGPVPEGRQARYLELEDQSARAYNRFVYRDDRLSTRVRRHLLREGVAEYAPPYGRALLRGQELVGMVAYLRGSDLVRVRLRGAMSLRRSDLLPARGGVVRRMKAAAGATLTPAEDDLYLSRISVAEDLRGRGVGRQLMDRFEAAAAERDLNRLVLDVDANADDVIAFYHLLGYRETGRGTAEDGERTLSYLHLAKPVS